jgi:hypothetical protein
MQARSDVKDPSAILDYDFDWNRYLDVGETIVSHSITVESGLTFMSSSEDAGIVKVWVSGGTHGVNYDVACLVTTSVGRTDERTRQVKVRNR